MRNDRQYANGTQAGAVPPLRKLSDAVTIPFAQRLTCTIAEACEASGLGRTKLYELITERQVDTTTIGRRRLVQVRSLRQLLKAGDG